MASSFTISDLRQRPEFFDAVADRIWRAWWERNGVPREYIETRLRENLGAGPIPTALVAHDGATFVATASIIASDLDERAHYTPWVAAVWVEPQFREMGVARSMVAAAAETGFAAGFDRLYLCSAKARRGLYEKLGWQPIEDDVGALKLTVFIRDRM